MSKWSEQREDTFSNMNTPPSLPGSNRKNGNFGMQDNKGLFAPSARLPRGHKPITAATSTGGRTSGSIGKLDRVAIVPGSSFKQKHNEILQMHISELPDRPGNSTTKSGTAAILRSFNQSGQLQFESKGPGKAFNHDNPTFNQPKMILSQNSQQQLRPRSSNQTNSMALIAASQRKPQSGNKFKSPEVVTKFDKGAVPSSKNPLPAAKNSKKNEIVDLLGDDTAEKSVNPDGHRYTNMPIEELLVVSLKEIWFGLLHIQTKSQCTLTIDLNLEFIAFSGFPNFSVEKLSFDQVNNIQFEMPINEADGYFAFNPKNEASFQCVSCGPGFVLDPVAKRCAFQKNITIQVSCADWEKVKSKLQSFFSKSAFTKTSVIHDWKNRREYYSDVVMKARIASEKLEKERMDKKYSIRSTIRKNQARAEYTKPEDNLTYLIYPIDPEAPDAVTISNGDLHRLEPGVYFNDNLIDFMIKHLLAELQLQDSVRRKKVYAFSCLFYAKLTEVKDGKFAHTLVSKWTKNVNLFDMECIIFPINLNNHWSLVILMRPDMLKDSDCDEVKEENEEQSVEDVDAEKVIIDPNSLPDRPMFLHLDSLNMHPTAKICANLASYIWHERKTRLHYPPDAPPAPVVIPTAESSPASDRQSSGNDVPSKDEIEVDNEKVVDNDKVMDLVGEDSGDVAAVEEVKVEGTEGESAAPSSSSAKKGKETPGSGGKVKAKKEKAQPSPAELFVKKLHPVKCQVPRQENGYDCGVFVIRFAEMIINRIPRTHTVAVKEKFKSQFFKEFNQTDIDGHRANIKSILESLQPGWKVARDAWLEKCKAEGIFFDDDEAVTAISPVKETRSTAAAAAEIVGKGEDEEWLPDEQEHSKTEHDTVAVSSSGRTLKRQRGVIEKQSFGHDASEQKFDEVFLSLSPKPVSGVAEALEHESKQGDEMNVDDQTPQQQSDTIEPQESVIDTAMEVDAKDTSNVEEGVDLPESKRRRALKR